MDSAEISRTRNRLALCRLPQLTAACRYYGLKVSGAKQEVVDRMLHFIMTSNPEERSQLPAALMSNTRSAPVGDQPVSSIRIQRPGNDITPALASQTSYLPDGSTLNDKLMSQFASIDPFHPIASIQKPFVFHSALRAGSMNMSLDLVDLKAQRRQGYSVWMRGICLTSLKDRHVWPKELKVFVNMQQIVRIDEPKRLKKRRDDPVDFTPFLQSGKNQIQISVTDPTPQSFVIALMFCSAVSDRNIASQATRQSRESCLLRLCEILQLKDEVIEDDFEGRRALSLRCPITLGRIQVPSRGTVCAHIRCFDLNAYVAVNRKISNINLRWICPICQQTVFPKDLIIDSYIDEILQISEAMEVLLSTQTGQWEKSHEKTEDEDEKDEEQSNTCTENEIKVENVIELDDTEEASSRQKPATPTKRPRVEQLPTNDIIDLIDD